MTTDPVVTRERMRRDGIEVLFFERGFGPLLLNPRRACGRYVIMRLPTVATMIVAAWIA